MKSVLITGAYGGMGRETAKLLAKNGYLVFALDIKKAQDEEGIIQIQADITSKENIENALPENTVRVTIEKGEDENSRIITVEGLDIE